MDTLCGNKDIYTDIKNWIDDFYNNIHKNKNISINSCIFISGNTGIGKTYSIKKICELLNLYMVYIDSGNCCSSDKLTDIINKSNSKSIYQIFTNNIDKKIIIIDEFDTLISIDRTISITLLNILSNEKLGNIPIICICSNEILKKIGDIKKKCKIFELSLPSDKDLLKIIKNKYKDIDLSKLKDLIKKCDGNISQLFKQLDTISDNTNYNNIDKIYEIEYLYSPEKLNRNIIKNIILIDPWLIPLKFHENLIIEFNNNRKGTKPFKFNYYSKFIYQLCCFDNIMYNNHIDIAIDYFASMVIYLFSNVQSKKNVDIQIKNFTKILSYLSLQKKYIKQSYSLNFPIYQIGNYHMNNINRNFIYFN
jgi:DNA polymerase III delta prime subunit